VHLLLERRVLTPSTHGTRLTNLRLVPIVFTLHKRQQLIVELVIELSECRLHSQSCYLMQVQHLL
jgi:hypothetical protein